MGLFNSLPAQREPSFVKCRTGRCHQRSAISDRPSAISSGQRITGHAGAILLTLLWLAGCAAPAEVREYPNQLAMAGKTKSDVFACAGAPLKELHDQELTFLRYYKEAPMLEESPTSGKGSFPTIRHGCWATVVLDHDRVVEVHYRFVPNTFDASDECEEIFEPCVL